MNTYERIISAVQMYLIWMDRGISTEELHSSLESLGYTVEHIDIHAWEGWEGIVWEDDENHAMNMYLHEHVEATGVLH